MPFTKKIPEEKHVEKPAELQYRTRAIITRGLYLFYPIFHCGLYLRAVSTAARLVLTLFFFHLKSPQKIE